MKKLISILLAVLMLAGSFVTVIGAEGVTRASNTSKKTPNYAKDVF